MKFSAREGGSKMYRVLKRDGEKVDFNISKISQAITKAFEAQNKEYHPSVIDMIALRVAADFEPKVKDGLIAVEDIQDSVESVLIQAGYGDIAKAYILYRRNREKIRDIGKCVDDFHPTVSVSVRFYDGAKLFPCQAFKRQSVVLNSLYVNFCDNFLHTLSYAKKRALDTILYK